MIQKAVSHIDKQIVGRALMYESKISNVKWIVYDLPGNVGWIMFLAGLAHCFTQRPAIMENKIIFVLLTLEIHGLEGSGYLWILCGGGLLCLIFGGLLLKEYKKV